MPSTICGFTAADPGLAAAMDRSRMASASALKGSAFIVNIVTGFSACGNSQAHSATTSTSRSRASSTAHRSAAIECSEPSTPTMILPIDSSLASDTLASDTHAPCATACGRRTVQGAAARATGPESKVTNLAVAAWRSW